MIFRISNSTQKKEKRMRTIKRRKKTNESKKLKTDKKAKNKTKNSLEKIYKNYYLQERIKFLLSQKENSLNRLLNQEKNEFCETNSSEIGKEVKYKQESRALVLIGLKDIINQLCEKYENLKFKDSFIFSVIALFDYYLSKSEKKFNRQDMVKALYACLYILDKIQKIGVFTAPFFAQFISNEIENEIIKTVNLNFNPVKIFDFFEIFNLDITQSKKNDTKLSIFIKKFKKMFIEMAFYFIFHEHSKEIKPSINFVSCLLLTYENTKYALPKGKDFNELFQFINKFAYSDEDYTNAKIMIEESFYVYKKLFQNINVNKS